MADRRLPQETDLEVLKRERSFLKSLIQNLPDLIWMKSFEGVYLACNEEFEKFFGAKEEEIIGKTDYDFVDKELADSFREHDCKAMEKREASVNEEWISYANDGHRALLETTKTPIFDNKGQIIGVLGIGHDITKRKQQEELIRANEERLKDAQNIAQIGSWELDIASGQLFWSEQVFRIFELDPTQFTPSYDSFLNAIHPQDRELLNTVFQRSLDEKKPYSLRHRLLINGKVKYVEEQGRTEYSEDGVALRTVGTVQDVTQHALYELQLNRLKSLIDFSSDGIYIIEAESSRIVDVNQSACDFLGYSKEEMLGFHVWDISHPMNCVEDWQAKLAWFIDNQGVPFEVWHRHHDGHLVPVEVTASYIQEPDGNFFIATCRDISERKKAEQEILESGQRYDAVLASSKDGFWVINSATGELEEVNDTYCRLSGYSRDELIGKKVWDLDVQRSERECRGMGGKMVREGGLIFESTHQRKDASQWPVEISISHSPVEEGRLFAFLRDISERKYAEQKIQFMAYHDVLTGLPNRQLLTDRLHKAIAMSERTKKLLAICYLDLDGFKPINDRYGHQAGDELLVAFAHRLKKLQRKNDTIARLGGDEFVVLLTDLNSTFHAEEIVQDLLDSIIDPFEVCGERVHISASIGVTVFPQDGSDTDTLLRHADQAMYQAKESGKNTYALFEQVQVLKMQDYLQSMEEFQHALLSDQLILHYQPRIDLQKGTLSSVEALVRWQHPERGFLAPGEFLPMIENTPLVIALDEWVLKTALDQHMLWRDVGELIPVSVNISPHHIKQLAFSDYVEELISHYPTDIAQYLELEVVETSAIGNTAQVAEIMNACTRLGIKFSLDDFGTGYSSLSYFHKLPISVLKIDRHFVQDMLDSVQDQNIVEGVLRLSDALNRPVVSEGVESIEIGLMLLQLGCQYAQGFGIAKPMPASEIIDWSRGFERDGSWQTLSEHILEATEFYDLNVAIFAHRNWLTEMKGYLESAPSDKEAPLDTEKCPFEHWYHGIGELRYGNHPLYKPIHVQFQHVQELAYSCARQVERAPLDLKHNEVARLEAASLELIRLVRGLAN